MKAELRFNDKLAEKLEHQLQRCAQVMEHELVEWKCVVQSARITFYELNHFTTVQLHHLRKNLGELKTCSTYIIKPDTLTVLQSISPEVTQISIQSFVGSVIERSRYNKNVPLVEPHTMTKNIKEESAPKSDEAKSKCDDLSDANEAAIESLNPDQQNIITTLRNTYDYTTQLILQAFKNLGDAAGLTDIEMWCTENYVKQVVDTEKSGLDFESDDTDSESPSSDECEPNDQQHSPRGIVLVL